MRFVVHQISALRAAGIFANINRERRQWYMIEGDALGACNEDHYAWVYDLAAFHILPALGLRPEPQLEEYEPEPEILPAPFVILEERHLPKVIVAENTSPALRLLKGGWFREERNEEEEDARRTYGYSRT